MASLRLSVVILVLCIFMLQCFHEVQTRGGRSGRAFRGTKRTATRRQVRRPASSSPNQPLPVTSYRSNIIKKQANNPSYSTSFRGRFAQGAVLGVLLYTYPFSVRRVYSHSYSPYHTSAVILPRERALRIQKEEYRVETANGENCTVGNVTENYTKKVLNVTTKVSYGIKTGGEMSFDVSNSSTTNVIIPDIQEADNYIVLMETLTRYNGSVIDGNGSGKNCTVISVKVRGYMVRMYDTNPNSSATICNGYDLAIGLSFLYLSTQLNW